MAVQRRHKPGNRRWFPIDLDPIMQRRFRDLPEYERTTLGDSPQDAFIGLIRLCDFLTDQIVITDMALLDGCLFHGFGPDRMLEMVGRNDPGEPKSALPFEVLCFGRNLEEGLRRAVAPRGGAMLRRLELAALDVDEDTRVRIGLRMKNVPTEEFDALLAQGTSVPDALAEILVKRCGAPEAKVAELADHWKSWIDAAARRMFTVTRGTEPWDGVIDEGFGIEPVDLMLRDVDEGARSVLLELDKRRKEPRSEILALLHERLRRTPSQDDREPVEVWYLASKLRAMAFANAALPVEFLLGPEEENVRRRLGRKPPRQSGRRQAFSLPPDTVKAVGIMPPAVYQMVRFQSRSAIRRWKSEQDAEAMKAISLVLATATEQVRPRSLLLTPVRLVAVAVAAAALGLYQNWDGWHSVWQIGLVVGLLGASVWADVLHFFRLRGQTAVVVDARPATKR